MVSARSTIFYKIGIDILYFCVVLSVYFVEIFKFMDKYYIGLLGIRYDYTNSQYGLEAQLVASYEQFSDHFCDPGIYAQYLSKKLCDNKDNLEIAGILFVVFSSLAHAFMAYGILNMIGKACGCRMWGLLKYDFPHYVYPGVYIVAVVLYLSVSQFYNMSPPSNYDSDYDLKIYFGVILMFFAVFLSVSSGIYFMFLKKKMNTYLFPRDSFYKSLKEEREQRKSLTPKIAKTDAESESSEKV
ncbi:unnamed protein product [Blepharisma stoltei]|uniref:Uncharacterized protein n=1 Tax=Blepharisma stoltei TaxID=1481888 RepID=A0AAU9JJU9_9CILI|nr:unnamed protein product [Blepharisma stoltei]